MNHFEINVSRDGKHLFATAERSLIKREEAYRLFDELRALFPAPRHKVTMTHWEVVGRPCAEVE